MPARTRRGAPDRRTLLALGVAVLCTVVVLLAASSGPVRVWSEPPPGPPRQQTVTINTEAPQNTVTLGTLPPPEQSTTDGLVWRIVAAVGFAVLVWLAVVVVSTWLRMLRRSEWRRGGGGARFDLLPDVPEPVVTLDVDAAHAALAGGTPRNAIVACWLQLEHDAAAAGLARHPAETSAEYTARVVGASSVDRAPIDELGALYREARFSRHELDDGHRERAVAALVRVAAALARPAAAPDTEAEVVG
jgi:hypothetical protein